MAIYDLFKSYVMLDLIEKILCYISLLKSLCYQTEESIPILQTNSLSLQFHSLQSFLCNFILCTKRTLIEFVGDGVTIFHFLVCLIFIFNCILHIKEHERNLIRFNLIYIDVRLHDL